MHSLTFTQPDDWHLHVRDGEQMVSVIAATARCFARAIIMPNLKPPVTTVSQALAYRERICNVLAPETHFTPLMTLYLTDHTTPNDIAQAKATGEIVAVKYYPAGATTHSEAGVTDLRKVWQTLEAMQLYDVPLLVHGEVVAESIDIFDKERIFIEQILDPLRSDFPELRIVLEHITTQEAVEYVTMANNRLAATITAHHLTMNRNALFQQGIRPHHYCLPVLKRESHRHALLQAATSGNPKFFLGTDSAPHAIHHKETACGCAGMYTAPLAIELYAEAFEAYDSLDKLEGFASFYGADFYRLPRNTGTITLMKKSWQMPHSLTFGTTQVIPLRAGENINWQLA